MAGPMRRKHRRLLVLLAAMACLGGATALGLSAFRSSIVFFLGPTQVATKPPPPGRSFRLGGLVAQGSVHHSMSGATPVVHFAVTDGKKTVSVRYAGVLPDLFREGQGIVALGALAPNGTFVASEVLAKHDATYMPPDVVAALKKAGEWNPKAGPPPPAAQWDAMSVKRTKQGS